MSKQSHQPLMALNAIPSMLIAPSMSDQLDEPLVPIW